MPRFASVTSASRTVIEDRNRLPPLFSTARDSILGEPRRARSEGSPRGCRTSRRGAGFGWGAAIVLAAVAAAIRGRSHGAASALLCIAAFLVVVATAAPSLLLPFEVAWRLLGTPLQFRFERGLLALLFYGVFVPAGMVMRICGNDALRRRFDASASTYWLRRAPPGICDMRREF